MKISKKFKYILFFLQMCVATFLLTSCCRINSFSLPIFVGNENFSKTNSNEISVQYLGSGGFLICSKEQEVMTAPFFSNFSINEILSNNISSKKSLIDTYINLSDFYDVSAILVGHSHYDHLIDVPYIATKYAPLALICGTETTKNTLLPVLPSPRFKVFEPLEISSDKNFGKWFYLKNGQSKKSQHFIRILAIQSEHAPHFGDPLVNIKLFKGSYKQPLKSIPTNPALWKEGETVAYLIDFLDQNQNIIFRIHYQDASSTPPLGLPHQRVIDEYPVDVAIMCLPGFQQVKNYPEGIIEQLKPRFVILGHWENFFKPWTTEISKLKRIPTVDYEKFIERLKKVLPTGSKWYMPKPGAWISFPKSTF